MNTYEPPYNKQEIIKYYSKEIAKKLLSDPVHKWRAETGIELLHKEPTKEEQLRTINNWKLMTNEQKKISDEKSIDIFGKNNIDRIAELLSYWKNKE